MSHDERLVGALVRDPSGADLGTVTALRLDPDDLSGRWLDVRLLDGTATTVPVQAASTDREGRVILPFTADDLRSAPRVDGPTVPAALAADLLRHYGFPPEQR